MKLRSKLLAGGVALVAATIVIMFVLVRVAGGLIEDQAFDSLRSVREAKATQVEAELSQFMANLDVIANAEGTIESITRFDDAFQELGEPVSQGALDAYYELEFIPRTGPVVGNIVVKQPDEESGRKLQELYIATNPHPVGQKDNLFDARDGSTYSDLHARYHGQFQSAQQNFGAYDIFLIDDRSGNVLYSVFKEIDVGTSLVDGPHALSGLGDAWRLSLRNDAPAFSDFRQYLPSYGQPAAFAAQGIYGAGGFRIGTVAMQAPIDRINDVMTSNQRWSEVGLGESGETYIVSANNLTMRNDSRFLIEDPDGYFEAINSADFDEYTVRLIEAFNTTVGLQQVDTEGTADAFAGNADERIFDDYRGVSVLSSYRPIQTAIPGVDWVVMSEIDSAEAFAAQNTLIRIATITMLVAAAVLLVLTWFFSGRLTRPLKVLEDETLQVEAYDFTQDREYRTGRLEGVAERRDEIGDLAGAFSRMVKVLGYNVRTRTEAEAELNVAAEIQESMLPLTFPSFPESIEFQMHARLVPAKEIGGDFYEHGFVDDRRFFFTVGDVSGKGVPAALFMAAIKTLIRSGAMQGEPLDELLTRINGELSRENPEMMFATVWIGVLHLDTGRVEFVNAGHNPPLIVTAAGPQWIEEIHGPMVGPIPGIEYTSGSVTLDVGDLIVVFSDGVTEAMNPSDALYGEDQLADLMTGDDDRADLVTATIVESVLAWEDGSERSDDVTVLALRYSGMAKPAEFQLVLPYTRPPEGETLDRAVADDLSRMNADLEAFAAEKGVPDEWRMKMQVAIDEVLTNSASYSGASAVAIRAWADTERFAVDVSDDGDPFNPLTEASEPDTTQALEDRAIGGLGLILVRNLIPVVEYEYTRACNVLRLVIEGEAT